MRRSQTNKYIFNSPENVCTFSAGSRKATGRAFQTRGPAAEHALSPNVVLVRGVSSRCVSVDERRQMQDSNTYTENASTTEKQENRDKLHILEQTPRDKRFPIDIVFILWKLILILSH